MAYIATGLEVRPQNCFHGTAGGNVAHEAEYATADAAATVEAANYFNSAADRLPKGTVIRARMALGGTPVLKQYIVTANTGTAVTIALQATTAG